MSFRLIWPAAEDVGAQTVVSLRQKDTSSPSAGLHLKIIVTGKQIGRAHV